ncbi:hypothetical protein A0H81_07827 [Grifola frondosa]|uniref:Uncharacterized protein n=1 Tax=Grifola frondosa TaxID=5627 RepID=A0A1C7M6T9_GRIFR|nr:hypothetical protein A0H81_07827 [Grifola frondosa]
MSQSANGTVAGTQLTSDQISRTSALQDGISQSELNPYSPSVHRADPFNTATSAHIYPTNITAYGSSLSGATSSLSAAHYSPEERAPVTPAATLQNANSPPTPCPP